MREETGLDMKINKLFYVCDVPEASPSLLHITFLLDKVSGEIRMPTNQYETTHIHDVKMVPIPELATYGFSETFIKNVVAASLETTRVISKISGYNKEEQHS